ncbi:hypothetical protein SAMN02910292_00401 [Lachnospiraceae bacterium XBB2008]|nr:hypothetical protein SAMN02910292_00401 [Lachnospiraceae bacterium XBB2008]
MTYREESCSQVMNRVSESADGRGISSLQGQTYALQRRKLFSSHESGFGSRGWQGNQTAAGTDLCLTEKKVTLKS